MGTVGNGPCAMHNVRSRGDQRNPQRGDSGEGRPVRQRRARVLTLSVLAGGMLIFSGTFGEAFAATNAVHPPIAKSSCSVRPAVTTAARARREQPAGRAGLSHGSAARQQGHEAAQQVRDTEQFGHAQQVRDTEQVRHPQPIGHAEPVTGAQPAARRPARSPTPSTSPTTSKSPTPSTSRTATGTPTPSKSPSPSKSPTPEQEPHTQQEPDPEQEPDTVAVSVRREGQALRLGPAVLEQQRPAGEDRDLRDLGLEHWRC